MSQAATRLRAARLAAGFVVGKDAADALGMPAPTYRAHENGASGITASLLHGATNVFGVSENYLRSGDINTSVDGLAERLFKIIHSVEAERETADPGEYAQRLKQIRLTRGFRTAASAAQGMAWAAATYTSHEAGYNPVPLDRLIGYAMAFGARPEFAVRGEMPVMESSPTGWRDLRSAGELRVSEDASAWAWLRSEAPGWPVLILEQGRFVLARSRLNVPDEMLPRPLSSMKGSIFAFVDRAGDSAALIVDPSAFEGPMVHVGPDGVVAINRSVTTGAVTDPIQKRLLKEPFRLGGLVLRIKISSDDAR